MTEVSYIEISARRLAAQRASSELESFRSLPSIDPEQITRAKETFTRWERSAASRLKDLEESSDIEHRDLHRRQAQALSRITVRDVLRDLVATGVVSDGVAQEAGDRIVAEISLA